MVAQVIVITLPPLRKRREDLRLLVEHILARHDAEDKLVEMPEELRQMLYHYGWPGNVRELTNTIQRYLATDSVALPGHPPREASRLLRIPRRSLQRKMHNYVLAQP